MINAPVSQASATAQYHSSDRSKRWLSYSQVATYLSCEWKWYARYVTRIQDKKLHRGLAIGDAVHRAIASVLMGESFEQGLTEWKEETYGNVPEEFLIDDDGNNIMENFEFTARVLVDRILGDLSQRHWSVLVLPDGRKAVELELSVPMPGLEERFDGYAAHIDAIIQDGLTGTNWIVDWKNRGNFQNDASEEVNLQNAMYQLVAIANGIPITGTITYQIMNKAPAKPKLNKDGSMSRTRIATDWPTYKAALEENDLDPADYEDMRMKLDTEFIRPIKAYRSEKELVKIWNEVILPVAHAIAEDRKPLRNMSHFSCMNCDARPVCLASLRGHDAYEWLRAFDYDQEAYDRSVERGIMT